MNTDNEKAFMQSLRMPVQSAGELLSRPVFKGFASEDEILAAWQDGALSTEQETALKAALASSNSLRQQWLALSAAVPKTSHGAVWHGLFRWHWATIGMTASVALVGVLLFRQGQLPMMSGDSVAMQEPLAEITMAEGDAVVSTRLAKGIPAPEAKADRETGQKRQPAPMQEAQSGADAFPEDHGEVASAPPMADRAPPALQSPARLAPPSAPNWQTYLWVYRGLQAPDDRHDMARLAQAALAVEASQCAAGDVATLQKALQVMAMRYPDVFGPLEPDSEAGWCELGRVLEDRAEQALR